MLLQGEAAAGQDGEDAARHFEPFFERLVAVGVDSERDRFADVGPLGKLRLESLYGTGLVEKLGLEYSKTDSADITQLRTLAVGGAATVGDAA